MKRCWARGRELLHAAFGVRSSLEHLRADLRVRASYLVERCLEPMLRRFTLAATDETLSDTAWLESLLMILADKPAHSWSDEDRANFELRLNDLARQFKRLEALQKDTAATSKEGFEAYRLTLTEADGHEQNQVLWVDHAQQDEASRLVDKILDEPTLRNNPALRQAVLARLAKEVLQVEAVDEVKAVRSKVGKRVGKQRGKRKAAE